MLTLARWFTVALDHLPSYILNTLIVTLVVVIPILMKLISAPDVVSALWVVELLGLAISGTLLLLDYLARRVIKAHAQPAA